MNATALATLPPAQVRGSIRAQLVGRDGRTKLEVEQHNLILDKFLDYILTNQNMAFNPFYIAVGTGSTAPAVGQTALVAEVARSSTYVLGTNRANTLVGTGHYAFETSVTFDYNQANGNLAEFGCSPSSTSAGGVMTRELFRDGSNNPIVVTKTSGEKLVITYRLELIVTPTAETAAGTVDITGIGAGLAVTHVMCYQNNTFNYGAPAMFGIWASTATPNAIRAYTAAIDMSGDGTGNAGAAAYGGPLAYVNGTFYRDFEGERPAEAADVTVYGWSIGYWYGSGNARNADGYRVKLAASFLKSKDYKLKLAARLSVSR